ncbi:LysR family transcriptional regulator [Microbulbifer variabilis]|uniref:LysR family transcriptional regulator n=1 Tax=Microbulbifer variabilis TaxID=266805 RepID=UPI001CFCC2EF|nr:LysR family transcriptional regulator [Microbulbifer variabilis]
MALFCRVVELGSFVAAADDQGISPAIVGRHVADLENLLGLRLINRTTRAMEITEAGQLYYQGCKEMLDQLVSLEQVVSGGRAQTPSGIIRISAPEGLGSPHLLELIESFQAKYPDVLFDLSLDNDRTDFVSSNVDIAIRMAISLEDSSLIMRKLAGTPFVLVASPNYLREHGTPKTLADLSGHACLSFGATRLGNSWPLVTAKGIRKFSQPWRLVLNQTHTHRDAIARGMGIGLLPRIMVEELIDQGKLVPIELDAEFPVLGIYAVYPSRKFQPNRVRLFLEHLQEMFCLKAAASNVVDRE